MNNKSSRLMGKINKRTASTEFASEMVTRKTEKQFFKISGVKGNLTERPGTYEVYPGE